MKGFGQADDHAVPRKSGWKQQGMCYGRGSLSGHNPTTDCGTFRHFKPRRLSSNRYKGYQDNTRFKELNRVLGL